GGRRRHESTGLCGHAGRIARGLPKDAQERRAVLRRGHAQTEGPDRETPQAEGSVIRQDRAEAQRGGGPIATPHGDLPTRIVETTFSDAVSMTETSFEDPFAVYRNLPSDVTPTPQGRFPTRT